MAAASGVLLYRQQKGRSMKKVLTIFLLAAVMCVLENGCSYVPVSQSTESSAIKDKKDTGIVVIAPVYCGDADRVEATLAIDETDYMAVMCECCLTGDLEAGRAAEASRNNKIDATSPHNSKISFDELLSLSKVITIEAGSSWLPMEWKMMVGEVVINRAESVEFPDTIVEVIHQKGQYALANTDYFETLTPYEDCVTAARRLLSGERVINDPSVVFQSGHKQGSGIYLEFYDRYDGRTYLCYSSHPELYR